MTIDHPPRLEALRATALLDTAAEERFDRFTRLAAAGARAAIVVFSLVDDEREFIKSQFGLTEPLASTREIPLSHSLAEVVVGEERVLRVRDARASEALRRHPAVLELSVVGYLGVPVRTAEGHVLGALAAVSDEPRQWSEGDEAVLREVAELIAQEIAAPAAGREGSTGGADRTEYLEELFEANPDAVVLLDQHDRILRVNPQFTQLFGYSEEEAVGRLINELLAPGELMEFADLLTGRAHSGERLDVELERRRRDGSRVRVALTAAPLGSDGNRGVCAVYRDVTERYLAREALERSEERFRSVTEKAHDVITIVGPGGSIEYIAPSVDRVLGLSADELVGSSFFALLHPGDAPRVIERFTAISSGPAEEGIVEARVRHGDGSWRTVELLATDMRAVPAVGGIVINIRDVTTEAEAVQRYRRLHSFLEATPDFVATFDPHGRALDVNDSFRRVLGLEPEQSLADLTLPDLFPPAVTERLLNEGIPAAMRHGIWTAETSITSSAGVEVPISQVVLAHRGEEGSVRFLSTLGRDISDRKRAETALRQSEAQFRSLIENAHDIITVIDAEGTVIYESPAVERVLGYPAEDLLGRHVFDLLHPEDVEHTRFAFEWILQGNTATRLVEFRFRHRDGSWRTFEAVGRRAGAAIEADAVVINARDITERKATAAALHSSQEQLLQAQKMEAVGRLAGGVAHDFNNLLTAIKGFTELLLLDLDDPDPRRAFVAEIQSAANRAARLTRQLLAFSRKQVLQPRVLDLNAAVSDMEKMLQRLVGENLALETRTAKGLWRVKADPGQVEQVLMNLVVNARDAMQDGGHLVIQTRNETLRAEQIPSDVDAPPGDYVALLVSDTGCGMDEATLARVFEPFFTTKEQGKGTGLGLSTVYGIVRQSGGLVQVESAPGEGTTFRVYLPRVHEQADAREADAAPELVSGSETILLVEDEPAVRVLVRRVLGRVGYRILEAANGADALQLSAEFAEPIDLLLTDVVMPGMSGRQLADQLTASRTGLRVLYMSGYTDEAIVQHGVLEPGVAFIEKPFTPEILLRRVREVIVAGSRAE